MLCVIVGHTQAAVHCSRWSYSRRVIYYRLLWVWSATLVVLDLTNAVTAMLPQHIMDFYSALLVISGDVGSKLIGADDFQEVPLMP